MKTCPFKSFQRRKYFKRQLLSARHYELVWVMDLTLALFYPTQELITCAVKNFITNRQTIQETIRMSYCYATRSTLADDYYCGKHMVEVYRHLKKLCGIEVLGDMKYKDLMGLKAVKSFKVIRHAVMYGSANRFNRDENFIENYSEFKIKRK